MLPLVHTPAETFISRQLAKRSRLAGFRFEAQKCLPLSLTRVETCLDFTTRLREKECLRRSGWLLDELMINGYLESGYLILKYILENLRNKRRH